MSANKDPRNNVYVGNITVKGVEKTSGGLTTFSMACYNGKEESPFFLRIKAFGSTNVNAKLEAKNRVAVQGNLRVERWQKSIEGKDPRDMETLTVFANSIADAPWEAPQILSPLSAPSQKPSGADEQIPF
jgi:single-stranded DNA-binding protein